MDDLTTIVDTLKEVTTWLIANNDRLRAESFGRLLEIQKLNRAVARKNRTIEHLRAKLEQSKIDQLGAMHRKIGTVA